MQTQTIEYDDGETKARIVVSAATALQGMKRSRLAFEAGDTPDPDVRILRGFFYPALLAAAQSIEINGTLGDPSFDDFCRLPEVLVKRWEDAALGLNPHWLGSGDDEKKDSN